MRIAIEGVQLKWVESFRYVGSTISADGPLDSKISPRIHKASQAFGKLKDRVTNQEVLNRSGSTTIESFWPHHQND
uniref:Reverse transcriptase domain-containing protein n=1 Tax=Octopus bimaculoides TaxID=37653 RepID=A0A0L8I936_OCTBM